MLESRNRKQKNSKSRQSPRPQAGTLYHINFQQLSYRFFSGWPESIQCVFLDYSDLYIGMPCAEVSDRVLLQQYRISPCINIGVLCSQIYCCSFAYSIYYVRMVLRSGNRARYIEPIRRNSIRKRRTCGRVQSSPTYWLSSGFLAHMLYGAGYIYIYVHVTRVQDGGRQEQLSNQKGEKKKKYI